MTNRERLRAATADVHYKRPKMSKLIFTCTQRVQNIVNQHTQGVMSDGVEIISAVRRACRDGH